MVYTQFIDGALTTGSNRESWINYNPANNNPLGEVCQANDEDIEAAVNSSEKAFHIWKYQNRGRTWPGFIKSSPYIKIQVGENCFVRNPGCWKAHFGIPGCGY